MSFRKNRRNPALGHFLHELRNWHWFFTLTYGVESKSLPQAERDLRWWANRISKEARGHTLVAIGLEVQQRGALHFHGMLCFEQDAKPVPQRFGETTWCHGNALVEDFDAKRGGAWYVAKEGDWALVVGCNRRNRCRRASSCQLKNLEVPILLP